MSGREQTFRRWCPGWGSPALSRQLAGRLQESAGERRAGLCRSPAHLPTRLRLFPRSRPLPAVPSGAPGSCSAGPRCVRTPVHLCVCVGVCRCARGVCTVLAAVPHCITLAERVRVGTALCVLVQQWLFLDTRASSVPVGSWHPWICRDLLCLHVLRVACSLLPGLTCVPLPAWTSPVLCCVLSATQCSLTTHATENGWVSKQGCRGGQEGGQRAPPLPAPQTHQEAVFNM